MDAITEFDAARGRRHVVSIALGVWLPPLLSALFHPHANTMAVVIPGLLLFGVLRRWRWARTWTVVTLGVGAVGALAGVFLAPSLGSRGMSALTAASWALAAGFLERSEAIDAYYDA